MEKENNILLTENLIKPEDPQSQPDVRLVDIQVTDENSALNLIVGFLCLAQKRGVFTIDESAKIWECISIFQKPSGR